MHGDLYGVILTIALIGTCAGVSLLFKGEVKRKIVHIGVSNFAFVYLYVFESDTCPLIWLCIFVLINYVVARKEGSTRYGTVLFPFSIIILIISKMLGLGSARDVAVATLAMGWGDGFAALAGIRFGKTKMPMCRKKTVTGSAVVFFSVILCTVFVGGKSLLSALAAAIAAVIAEAYTPYGLDNVTVPVAVFLCCALI